MKTDETYLQEGICPWRKVKCGSIAKGLLKFVGKPEIKPEQTSLLKFDGDGQ